MESVGNFIGTFFEKGEKFEKSTTLCNRGTTNVKKKDDVWAARERERERERGTSAGQTPSLLFFFKVAWEKKKKKKKKAFQR